MNKYLGMLLAAFITLLAIEGGLLKIVYVSAYTYDAGGDTKMKRICDDMRDAGPFAANIMISTMITIGLIDQLVEDAWFKNSAKEALVDVMQTCAKRGTRNINENT